MVRKREKVGEDVGKDQEEGTAFKPLPLPQTSLRSVTGSDADVCFLVLSLAISKEMETISSPPTDLSLYLVVKNVNLFSGL